MGSRSWLRKARTSLACSGCANAQPTNHVPSPRCEQCATRACTVFQEMAADIQAYLGSRMPSWKETYPGVEKLKIAVMGCVVNGPGESKHADIGISLPGTGEEPKAPVYVNGRLMTTLKGPTIINDFIAILNEYLEAKFGQGSSAGPK